MKSLSHLPNNPSYELACELVDSEDLDLWRDIIARIATKHDIKIDTLIKINGWANGLFIINDHWVIKIVPPNWQSQAKREIEALRLVKGQQLPVQTPQLLADGIIDNWAYIIMTKMPGTNLSAIWSELNEQNQCLIAKQVAQFANTLHKIPLPEFTAQFKKDSELYTDWPSFLQRQAENCYEKHKARDIPKHLLDTIDNFLSTHHYQCQFEQYQLMHTDLHPGNLMVCKQDDVWHLSAVIDFGDALIGPERYFEFATSALLMGLGNKTVNHALLDAYDFTVTDITAFQQQLMALSFLRHIGGIDYAMKQFAGCEKLATWEDIMQRFYAF